jgi:hypothetical protein
MTFRASLSRLCFSMPVVGHRNRQPSGTAMKELELRLIDASLERLRRQREALLVEAKHIRRMHRMARRQAALDAEVTVAKRRLLAARAPQPSKKTPQTGVHKYGAATRSSSKTR